MAVVIPRPCSAVNDSASGAQVIDGSLRFNGTSNHLNRTPSSAGNRRTWTWSSWVKRSKLGNAHNYLFTGGITTTGESTHFRIAFQSDNKFFVGSYGYNFRFTEALFRDT